MKKGFEQWMEIFKGGPQTDSRGVEHDGDKIIEKALATFNAAEHEPPIVVGHPSDNSPAFGWVEGLKAQTKGGVKFLYAKVKEVVPEFADLVKRGVYKKRSAAFYPDGRLRHVGFLGGMPPAVKGLADIGFSQDENAACFEFSNNQTAPPGASKEERTMSWKDKLKEAFGRAVDDMPENEPAPAVGVGFSEADIKKARQEAADQAAKEAREQVEKEFAEKQAKADKETHKKGIAVFIADGVKAGKIPPAWKDAGIQAFMEGLDAGTEIEFAEGQEKKSQADWFKSFLESLPKLIEFGEIATGDKDPGDGGDDEKIAAMARKRAKEEGCTFTEAVIQVAKENPGLAG
ncbi:conserved hypothetical protein [Desulfatibacillum aliphaticivorans]|uniref:Uncharacterized protein n=1 Tax=Desulfatibacillum aliphaticivorans TaxID=218208 RepID=B8FC37_DESAL|nr:hypothetical protein [Desulfatibacillum aliphaticivorans]ACL05242.1 conserved hypothetical protein [Desulfatibacillum aliphaticivorans]